MQKQDPKNEDVSPISFRFVQQPGRVCSYFCVTTRVNPSDVPAWKTKESFADKVLKKQTATENYQPAPQYFLQLFLTCFGGSEVNYWWVSTRLYIFFNEVSLI